MPLDRRSTGAPPWRKPAIKPESGDGVGSSDGGHLLYMGLARCLFFGGQRGQLLPGVYWIQTQSKPFEAVRHDGEQGGGDRDLQAHRPDFCVGYRGFNYKQFAAHGVDFLERV